VGKDSEGGRGKKEPLYIYLYIYIYIYIHVNKKLYHVLKIYHVHMMSHHVQQRNIFLMIMFRFGRELRK
jgi:hypothetical protein